MWDNAYFSNMVRSVSCQLMFLMVRLELARYTLRPQNVMTGGGIAKVAPKVRTRAAVFRQSMSEMLTSYIFSVNFPVPMIPIL